MAVVISQLMVVLILLCRVFNGQIRQYSTSVDRSSAYQGEARPEMMEATQTNTDEESGCFGRCAETGDLGIVNIASEVKVQDNTHAPSTPTLGETAPTRYLLSLVQNRTGLGNNVQYRFFKITVGQAWLHNRTVVAVPFFNNGCSGWGYTLESMRPLEKTFDVDKLKELVSVATMDEFKQNCGGKIRLAFQEDKNKYLYPKSQDFFEDIYRIHVPPLEDVLPAATIKQLLSSNEKCVALFHCYTDPKNSLPLALSDDVFSTVNRYVKVSKRIRTKVNDEIFPRICDGGRLLAVHYRNRTGEMCMYNERFTELCAAPGMMKENDENAEVLVDVIYDVWLRRGYDCVYVAHPSWSQKFTDLLSGRISRMKIMNGNDVLKMKLTGMDEYRNDNYYFSLLEQEICIYADGFIGWEMSYWDRTVLEQRKEGGKESLTFSELGIQEKVIEQLWKHFNESWKENSTDA
ncbi:uncharacterized protein [Ptychodera flava]|uniref:uncharacterized protein n=1 Tax=Ptychodera flava TaxID=63121 RepID=UPI00396A923B